MNEEYKRIVQTIEWTKGNKNYQDCKQLVESVVSSIVKNENLIIGSAIGAVLTALENHATPESRPYVSGFSNDLINRASKSAHLIMDEIQTSIHVRLLEQTFAELGKENPMIILERSLEITERQRSQLVMVLKNRNIK